MAELRVQSAWGRFSNPGHEPSLHFHTRDRSDEVEEPPSEQPQPRVADGVRHQPGEAGERQDLPRHHLNLSECSLAPQGPEFPDQSVKL